MSLSIPYQGRNAHLSYRAYNQNGVAELNPSLTINSTTVTPTLRYKGGDATATTWAPWGYGETLTKQTGLAPVLNEGSPGLGANDDSVTINKTAAGGAGGYYLGGSADWASPGTDDMVIEAVYRVGDSNNRFIMGTRGGGVDYWMLEDSASPEVIIDDGVEAKATSAALVPGAWYHLMAFLDRSGSAQIYVNAEASGAAVDITGAALTLSGGNSFAIGSDTTGSGDLDNTGIAYLAMWHSAAWLSTHLNATVAAERFAALTGTYPNTADGTALPSVMTRAYPAYGWKDTAGVRKYYYFGSEWIPLCRHTDENGDVRDGILYEPAGTNAYDEFEDIAAWTKADAGDAITDDAATAPNGETKAAKLVCDNTNGDHKISDATPGNLSAATWNISAHVGPGNADWVKLTDDTVANAHCWFNVSTGAVGTKGAGAATSGFVDGIQFFGDADRRIFISFTGTVAPHTISIRPCDGDGVDTFSGGDGAAASLYIWGVVCELGPHPTSPIVTDGAAATRLKTQLRAVGDDGNLGGVGSEERGRIECYVCLPNCDLAADRTIIELSDGGAAADSMLLDVKATGDQPTMTTAATAGNAGSAADANDIADGAWHRVISSWITDDLRVYADGNTPGQDTSVDIPDNLDRIDIGQDRSAGTQFGGLISDLKIYRCNR